MLGVGPRSLTGIRTEQQWVADREGRKETVDLNASSRGDY